MKLTHYPQFQTSDIACLRCYLPRHDKR